MCIMTISNIKSVYNVRTYLKEITCITLVDGSCKIEGLATCLSHYQFWTFIRLMYLNCKEIGLGPNI